MLDAETVAKILHKFPWSGLQDQTGLAVEFGVAFAEQDPDFDTRKFMYEVHSGK